MIFGKFPNLEVLLQRKLWITYCFFDKILDNKDKEGNQIDYELLGSDEDIAEYDEEEDEEDSNEGEDDNIEEEEEEEKRSENEEKEAEGSIISFFLHHFLDKNKFFLLF